MTPVPFNSPQFKLVIKHGATVGITDFKVFGERRVFGWVPVVNFFNGAQPGTAKLPFTVSHKFKRRYDSRNGRWYFANLSENDAEIKSGSGAFKLAIESKQDRVAEKHQFFERPSRVTLDGKSQPCKTECAEFSAGIGITRSGFSGSLTAANIASLVQQGVDLLTDYDKGEIPAEIQKYLDDAKIFSLADGAGAANITYVICADAEQKEYVPGDGYYRSETTKGLLQNIGGAADLLIRKGFKGVTQIEGKVRMNHFKWDSQKSSEYQ